MKPLKIARLQEGNLCQIIYSDSEVYTLDAHYIRTMSPSADNKRHRCINEDVSLISIQPQGKYALKFIFSDGHDTGIYTWDYLYKIATQREKLWQQASQDKIRIINE